MPAIIIYYLITLGQCIASSGTTNATQADAVVVLAPSSLTSATDPNAVALANQALSVADQGSNLVIIAGSNLAPNAQPTAELVAQAITNNESASGHTPKVVTVGGTDLWTEAQNVATYSAMHNIKTVIVIVNPTFQMISGAMLSSNGLSVQFSPPNFQEGNGGSFVGSFLTEALEVSIGRITGYSIADSMFRI